VRAAPIDGETVLAKGNNHLLRKTRAQRVEMTFVCRVENRFAHPSLA